MSALGKKLRLCEGGVLMFRCPGCGEGHGVKTGPSGWVFNGDGDRPTFSPSVLVTGVQRLTGEQLAAYRRGEPLPAPVPVVCHSFVTDGHIQFLSDCTHALAGQTVELPDFSYKDE